MNTWPGNAYPSDPSDPTAGAPYGRQPFLGDWQTPPGQQEFGGQPGFAGQPGGYDPYTAAAFGGTQPGVPIYSDGAAQQFAAMQPYHPGVPYAPAYPAPRKEPALALVLSFFLPGLGTMINGQVGKGFGIMAGYFLGALLSVILIGLPIMFGFWIWGMVDAYSGAKEHNARHGYR